MSCEQEVQATEQSYEDEEFPESSSLTGLILFRIMLGTRTLDAGRWTLVAGGLGWGWG